jgi:type 1 glutamine amidotransferase
MGLALVLAGVSAAWGEGPKQVLLLGMKRDHPEGRHEYMAGLRLLAKCLEDVPQIKAQVVAADEPWPQGPELLKKADGVVLYLGQGAKWIQASPERMAAMMALAKRGGGITALHMAIMSEDPQYVEAFRDLVGGYHGGQDRRFIVMDGDVRVVDRRHPITQGVEDVRVHDEFYYQLKFSPQGKIQPLVQVPIEGQMETIG